MITTLEQEAAAIIGAKITLERARAAWNPSRSREFTSAMDALSDAVEMYEGIRDGAIHWETYEADLDAYLTVARVLGADVPARFRDYPEPHAQALASAAAIAAWMSATMESLLNGLEVAA